MATNKAFNLLTSKEKALFSSLDTPVKLQDFLENKIGYNLEEQGETCYSPRLVLRHRKANCVEGAIFAAAVLYYHGNPPLLGQLVSRTGLDDDHVLALYRKNGHIGAVSKTKYPYLGFREPIHRNLRELTLSYFECYYSYGGRKSIRSYTRPLSLRQFDSRGWVTSETDIFYVIKALQRLPEIRLLTPGMVRSLRPVTPLAKEAGEIWINKKRIMPYLKKQQDL